MKKTELRSLIREEIKKTLKEGQGQQDRYVSDYDEGIFIPLKKPFPTDEMKLKIAAAANAKYGVDIKFMRNKATTEYSIFVPFVGDYNNIMGILKKMNIPNNG